MRQFGPCGLHSINDGRTFDNKNKEITLITQARKNVNVYIFRKDKL